MSAYAEMTSENFQNCQVTVSNGAVQHDTLRGYFFHPSHSRF